MAMMHDKRVVVYPAYIDAKLSIAGGRKISQKKACENPTALEIVDCCNMALKLVAELEDKGYPRDFLRERDNGFMLMRGRARVKLFSEAGTPLNPDIPNRKVLYEKVAELCPRHPGRSKKAQAAAQAAAAKQLPAAASGAAAAAGSSSKQSGKGKKKRK